MNGKLIIGILVIQLVTSASNGQVQANTDMMFQQYLQQSGRNLPLPKDPAGLPVMYKIFKSIIQWSKQNPTALTTSSAQTSKPTMKQSTTQKAQQRPAGGVPVRISPQTNFQTMRKQIQQVQGTSLIPNNNYRIRPANNEQIPNASSGVSLNERILQMAQQKLHQAQTMRSKTFSNPQPAYQWMPPYSQPNGKQFAGTPQAALKMAQKMMQNRGAETTTNTIEQNYPPVLFPKPPVSNTNTPALNSNPKPTGSKTGINSAPSGPTNNLANLVTLVKQIINKKSQGANNQLSTANLNNVNTVPSTKQGPHGLGSNMGVTGMHGNVPSLTPGLNGYLELLNTMRPLEYRVRDARTGLYSGNERMEMIAPHVRRIQREGPNGETNVYIDSKANMGAGIYTLLSPTTCYVGFNTQNGEFVNATEQIVRTTLPGSSVTESVNSYTVMEQIKMNRPWLFGLSMSIYQECEGRNLMLVKPTGPVPAYLLPRTTNCFTIASGKICVIPNPYLRPQAA